MILYFRLHEVACAVCSLVMLLLIGLTNIGSSSRDSIVAVLMDHEACRVYTFDTFSRFSVWKGDCESQPQAHPDPEP